MAKIVKTNAQRHRAFCKIHEKIRRGFSEEFNAMEPSKADEFVMKIEESKNELITAYQKRLRELHLI